MNLPFFSGLFSAVASRIRAMLVHKVLNISNTTYLLVESLLCIVAHTPLIFYKKYHKDIKLDSQHATKTAIFCEIPRFINKLTAVEALRQDPMISSSILSSVPILNLAVEKYQGIISYSLGPINNKHNEYATSFLSNTDNIIYVDKERFSFGIRDMFMLAYGVSLILSCLDREEDDIANIFSAVAFSVIAIMSRSWVNNYTKLYLNDMNANVITYITYIYSLPILILSYFVSNYLLFDNSIDETTSNPMNIGFMVKLLLLSGINLASDIGANYAILNIKFVSDATLIMSVASNCFALVVNNNFDLTAFTINQTLSMILSILGCYGVISCNSKNTDLLDAIIQNFDLNESKNLIKESILNEFKQNINLQTFLKRTIDSRISELNLLEKDKALLVMLSKLYGINFDIKNKNDNLIFCIDNHSNQHNNKKIYIVVNYEELSNLTNKI